MNLQINMVIFEFMKCFNFGYFSSQLFSYYLEILHLILLNIWSHFHFIRSVFFHIWIILNALINFMYSFIHLLIIDREPGLIIECQRSLFLWSKFLHAITATPCMRASQNNVAARVTVFFKVEAGLTTVLNNTVIPLRNNYTTTHYTHFNNSNEEKLYSHNKGFVLLDRRL